MCIRDREYNESKLLRAGANKVINPYKAGGHRMAEMLSKPQVEDSISVVSPKHADLNLTLDEISLKNCKEYDNVTINDSKIRENYDVNIVGIIKDNGESIINPEPDTLLNTNDIILLIGDEDKMSIFKEQLPS